MRARILLAIAALMAVGLPVASQAASPNLHLVNASATVSLSFDTRYSAADSDSGSVVVSVRNSGDASGTATPPSPGSLSLPPGITASCSSCGPANVAPGATASWTYHFSGTASDSNTPAGSTSIPVATSSGTQTFAVTFSSTRQDAGRLQAQVSAGSVTLSCPALPGTIGATIAVTFSNVGDTSLSLHSPTVSHSSVFSPWITLAASSPGSASIPAHSSSVWTYRVQVDPDLANATAEAEVVGAGLLEVSYSTTRTRPGMTASLPYSVTIPVQVVQTNEGEFPQAEGVFSHDFGSVEMQSAASTTARFREACGYRDVALSATPVLPSSFASSSGSVTLPRNGQSELGFGVQFLPGTGADVCRRESWSYQVSGSVGSRSVFSRHFGFTAQPAFQDLRSNLDLLRAEADKVQPVSPDLQQRLRSLADGIGSRTQTGQGCAGSQTETALLAGVVQPLGFAAGSLARVDQQLDAGDQDGLTPLLVAGSAASRGIAQQCVRIGNGSATSADCGRAAGLLVDLWRQQAERARDHYASELGRDASQASLLEAHSNLALVYRALGQDAASATEEAEARAAAEGFAQLRAEGAAFRQEAERLRGPRAQFVNRDALAVPWNPVGYAGMEPLYEGRESALRSAVLSYALAGDPIGQRAAEAELDAMEEAHQEARFWGVAVLAAWVAALVGLCIQATLASVAFVKDQRTVSLGAMLFSPAGEP